MSTSVVTVLALACCVAMFWYQCPQVLEAADTAWILRTGDFIIRTGTLPMHDIFSWTEPNKPWVIYQWLFEVLAGGLFRAGGLLLAGGFACVVCALLYFYFLPRRWLELGVPLWLAFAMLLLALSPTWFYLRPQLASYLLIPLFLFITTKYAHSRAIWILVPLTALWANLHSFWFVGLIIIACQMISNPGQRRVLLLVLACSSAAVLANPYGWGLVAYNLSFLTEPDFKAIYELQSPLVLGDPLFYPFIAYVVVAWLCIIRQVKAIPVSQLVFAALSTIAALFFSRFAAVCVLATWEPLGLALSQFAPKLASVADADSPQSGRPVNHVLHFAAAFVLGVGCWLSRMPSEQATLQTFTNGTLGALNFIGQDSKGGRLFNDQPCGGRLILLGYGPVFIDSRFDFYGKTLCTDWLNAIDAKSGWKPFLQKWNPSAIAIKPSRPLFFALMDDPGWLLVMDDGKLTYWLRKDEENLRRIASWQKNPSAIFQSSYEYATHRIRGVELLERQDYQGAANEFAEMARLAPLSADPYHWQIRCFAETADEPMLGEALFQARPFFWKFPEEGSAVLSAYQMTPAQKARVDKWVSDAAAQLIKRHQRVKRRAG